MRYIRFATLLVALAGRSALAQVSPRHFVAAVEFRDTVATCVQPPVGLHAGERAYSLRFGSVDSARRIVTAVWAADGALLKYSDERGDLRPPFPANVQRNPRTTIFLDMLRHVALTYNDVDGEQQGSAASDADGALDLENLGEPRRMIERLRRQCGGGTPTG
jgi:hypothetical protein